MSDIPGRLYKLAKGYLDAARGRLEDISIDAQEELRRALPRENPDYPGASASPSAMASDYDYAPVSEDPMERAAAKLAAVKRTLAAQKELLTRGASSAPSDPLATPAPTAGGYQPAARPSIDDELAAAEAKVTAEAAANAYASPQAARPVPPAASPLPASATTDPMMTAYRIIGVPYGADFPTVQRAVEKLRQRCAPGLFAQGSPEQAQAADILSRVDDAYRVLQTALNAPDGRFDRLEF